MRHLPLHRFVSTALPRTCLLLLALGCSGPSTVEHPIDELREVPNSPRRQLAAMDQLDVEAIDETAYVEALKGTIWRPGYTIEVREAALNRLEERDLVELKRTIRQRLPQLNAPNWRDRLCEIIAERNWIDLTPALVSSWARNVPGVTDEYERAEYLAMVQLYGADEVVDVVFQQMLAADKTWQQGFRTRCWYLLHRLGQRDRLIETITAAEIPSSDGMLIDLQVCVEELGVLPINREEILWIRELRKPERADFWSQVVAACNALTPARREQVELRDLSVIVSASVHQPHLLDLDQGQLYDEVAKRLKGRRHYPRGDNSSHRGGERLSDARDRLTWGDLIAIMMALDALEVPQVVDHLFDYARRDHEDTSTEYGGVIDLDAQGRFEVLEFPPRIREHDQKFIASQEMFDAGYAALFHFHFHVQRIKNRDYAGPGHGDTRYANEVRVNSLVITSLSQDRMNVDFYRHGNVVVDLGAIEKG